MEKIRIKLISIGHMPFDFNKNKILKFRSSAFTIVGDIDSYALRCNADGPEWEFSDYLVRSQLPKISEADLAIAIVSVPLQYKWYTRVIETNRIAFSYNDIKKILDESNIPLENALLRVINAYALAYKKLDGKIKVDTDIKEFAHDETRGCIFDMNGLLSDIVASCHSPIICDDCQERLRSNRVSNGLIMGVQKDIRKIRKGLYYVAFDFLRKHPIWSLAISSIFASSLGISSSIAASYLYDYLKIAFQNN
ncbi:hypothetical protein [Azospirillum himalayense]|uniref:Uncharacterized protein n=1 Tax=Azospirillum himalayense TaxID=654847 RepID=A0ABW0GFE6_9PROT